jgi:hypothetical protein
LLIFLASMDADRKAILLGWDLWGKTRNLLREKHWYIDWVRHQDFEINVWTSSLHRKWPSAPFTMA